MFPPLEEFIATAEWFSEFELLELYCIQNNCTF
jgi:hypothetical protein